MLASCLHSSSHKDVLQWVLKYIKQRGSDAKKIVIHFNHMTRMSLFWMHSQAS